MMISSVDKQEAIRHTFSKLTKHMDRGERMTTETLPVTAETGMAPNQAIF
jgi:hypothetical protein